MKKIIVKITPFQRKQQIYIYDTEQKVIPSIESDLDNLDLTILDLAQSENITRVDLSGPKKFTEGIKVKLKETQMTLYKKDTLEINLI